MLFRYDEDDVTAFPVVKETGDKLIETGINTLQSTLLLKKEVEVDQVQSELEAKRQEFKQRMDACAQRQIEIQKKQQRVCMHSIAPHTSVLQIVFQNTAMLFKLLY